MLIVLGPFNQGFQSAVSHRRISPPEWLRLGNEPRPPPHRRIPIQIFLDETARCCCGSSFRDPAVPSVTGSVKVFGVQHARIVRIEMVKCQADSCRRNSHRFLIPDCSEYGLMIWSRYIALEHNLLFNYLSQFSRSETPMVTFVLSTRQNYEQTYSSHFFFSSNPSSHIPFFSYSTFTRVSPLIETCDYNCKISCSHATISYRPSSRLQSLYN